MSAIYVGTHLPEISNEYLSLNDVDFTKDILHLKNIIGTKIQCEAEKFEVIHNGLPLNDDDKLCDVLKAEDTVHCFPKKKTSSGCAPKKDGVSEESIRKAQELFQVIANIQININCRLAILKKILAQYPEFRENLAASVLIRDSVLFNTLHRPNVIKSVAEHYPIIIEAAPFIVSTVKKELTRFTSSNEPASDSTNSSEEDNSLSDRSHEEGPNARNRSESARLRLISRQQLQAALAEIGFGSVNSLTNIANSEAALGNSDGGASSLSMSASDERISTSILRSQLQRAFDSFEQGRNAGIDNVSSSGSENPTLAESMDMDVDSTDQQSLDISDNEMMVVDGDIPTAYRTHQYAEQLRTMAQMGFLNHEENLTYLNLSNGNIENAINLLMAAM